MTKIQVSKKVDKRKEQRSGQREKGSQAQRDWRQQDTDLRMRKCRKETEAESGIQVKSKASCIEKVGWGRGASTVVK